MVSEPACLLVQILTGFNSCWLHHMATAALLITRQEVVCTRRSESRPNFSHHLYWRHNWFTEFTWCPQLKSCALCMNLLHVTWLKWHWILTIMNTVGHQILKSECSVQMKYALEKQILKFPPCAVASCSAWVGDRWWCTRWCLRPAEWSSSWSSAESGWNTSGFRFKGKAREPPATGVQSALALRFDSNFPFKDSTCTIYLVQQKYAAWALGEKGKVWAATGVRSEFML